MNDVPRPEARAGIARWYTIVEDVVYLGLGLLLTGIVVLLLVSGFIHFGRSVLHGTLSTTIVELLEQILLVFVIVELLYTVKISFREHALLAEPFLLVGMISVIRRVLVLTAQAGERGAQNIAQSFVLELAVLGALILVLAIALVLLRTKGVTADHSGASAKH